MGKPIKACRECAHLTREPGPGKNRLKAGKSSMTGRHDAAARMAIARATRSRGAGIRGPKLLCGAFLVALKPANSPRLTRLCRARVDPAT